VTRATARVFSPSIKEHPRSLFTNTYPCPPSRP
jgi:hypothetical protein